MSNAFRTSVRWALIGLALLLAAGFQPLSAQTCNASSSWVTSPSQPNFNQDPTSLCAFYQYAWQSFLYLTSQAPGGGGALNFETLATVSDVIAPAGKLQGASPLLGRGTLFLDKRTSKARRFVPRGSKPGESISEGPKGTLLDESGKTTDADLPINQAGSQGVLVDQNNNVTYYEQFLDPIAQNFIQSCSLNVTACQTAPAAANLRFPAGAIEIKVSWRPLPYGTANANSYYTVPNVEVFNPQTNQNMTVDLGLVGFHLVYTTPGHKEMVWASFEHVDNAPNGPCTGPTTPPAGFSGWAFNKATSTDCSKVNAWTKGTLPPYPVTQAFLNYAFGSDGSTKGKNNSATIQNLNKSVLGFLPSGSVWSNYFLLGGVWTDGSLPAIKPTETNSNEFGSLFLANVTMETFTQFPNPPTGSGPANCFNCHNAETTSTNPPNPPAFKVSHALTGNAGSCPYSTTLPAACQNTQTLTVQLMSAHGKKTAAKK
jgi:hypothetical protein